MKTFFLSIIYCFIFQNSFSQLLFSKCFSNCGAFPHPKQYLSSADIVQDSSESCSYILFNAYDENFNYSSNFCKIDSAGNNIILQSADVTPQVTSISANISARVLKRPERIFRLDDNHFILLSITDSTVLDSTQAIEYYSWLSILSFDSTLTQTANTTHFLGNFIVDEINDKYINAAQLLPDSIEFLVSFSIRFLNSGSSIMVGKFNVTGTPLSSKIYYLNGSILTIYDMKISSDASAFLLLNTDSSSAVLKIDSALNVIWCKKYFSSIRWFPKAINVVNDSLITIVSQSFSLNDSKSLISYSDSGLNNLNAQILRSDTSCLIHYVYPRGSKGLLIIISKLLPGMQPTWTQEVMELDSIFRINYNLIRNEWPLTVEFCKLLENRKGYLSLTTKIYFTTQFGDFVDVFFSQLDHQTEDCFGMFETSLPYYFSPVNLTVTSIILQDSVLLISPDTMSITFYTDSTFYYTDCTGYVGATDYSENAIQKIEITPNPVQFSGSFTFNGKFENVELKIYNSIGMLVKAEYISDLNSYTFYPDLLSSGLYFFEIHSHQVIGKGKFVIGR